MNELLTFDDVLIVPQFSTINSRSEIDLKSNQKSLPILSFPVISANMDTITGHDMAREMQYHGGQAVLHRFCSIDDNVNMFLKSEIGGVYTSLSFPMVSIGLGEKELERAEALRDSNAQVFVIDVAHGASMAVAEQVKALRELIGKNRAIIVGNFATGKSVSDFLKHSGTIEGIKVGVGPGSSCTTRIKTGIGRPQLSAVLDISQRLNGSGITIIADGGMKNPGDIAKAIGAGAHAVMLGGMLAGTEESPGDKIHEAWDNYLGTSQIVDDKYLENYPLRYDIKKSFKKFRGSASKESYEVQGKEAKHRTSEGESFLVPYKGPVADILQDIEGGLRSSFSYVGARNMQEFHEKVEFVRITNAGYVEGTPHGKKS